MNMRTNTPLYFGLLALGLTGMVGCQTAKQPGSRSHASGQVQGRSVAEIQQTATAVFREEGYSLALATPEEMFSSGRAAVGTRLNGVAGQQVRASPCA